MSASTLKSPAGGGGSGCPLMTGLNGIKRFCLCGSVWTTSFSHCLSCNWWAGSLALPLLRRGTPTDSQAVTLRVLIFLASCLCQRLLMLWAILFFFWGPRALREISSVGCQLGGLWKLFVALQWSICSASGLYASSV